MATYDSYDRRVQLGTDRLQHNDNAILQTYHAQLIGTLWRRTLQCLHPAHPCYTFVSETTIRNLFADQTLSLREAVNLALFCVSARVTREKFDRLLFHLEHLSGPNSSPLLTYDRLIDYLLTIVTTRQHDLLWEAFLLLGHAKEARAVEPLLTALTDRRGWVRMAAAYALGRIGDKRAVEPLHSLLHEERDDLRWITVGALTRLDDEPALEPFLDALTDPCRTVRNFASSALRNKSFLNMPATVDRLKPLLDGLNDPILVTPLIPIALNGDEQAMQQAVVSLVEPLLEHLKSARRDSRRDVVLLLGKIGDQRAIAPLLTIFAQQDLGIQTVIVTALEQIKMPPAVKQQAMASLIEPLLDHLKRDDLSNNLHLHVIRLLSKIGDQRVVAPLMAIFAQQDLATQTVIVTALEQIELSPAIRQQVTASLVEPLLERLKSDDAAKHLQIVQLLGKIGDQRVVTTLLTMLAQSKADMQIGIIEALEQIGTRLDTLLTIKQQVADILMQALLTRFRSDDAAERAEAVQVLGQIGFERSIFPLIPSSDYEEWFSDEDDTQAIETLLEELFVSLHS